MKGVIVATAMNMFDEENIHRHKNRISPFVLLAVCLACAAPVRLNVEVIRTAIANLL